MSTFADFKARALQLTNSTSQTNVIPNSITLLDGTNTVTMTATSISTTGSLALSNVALTNATSATPDTADSSTKVATTAYVKNQPVVAGLASEVSRATTAEGVLTTAVGLKEATSNKSGTVTTETSDDKYPSVKAVKTYVDAAVTAETNRATGAENTLTTAVGLKEVSANKSTNVTTDGTSDAKYPSVMAVKTYVDAETTRATAAELTLTNEKAPKASPTFTGTVKSNAITSVLTTDTLNIATDLTGTGTVVLGSLDGSSTTTINGGTITQTAYKIVSKVPLLTNSVPLGQVETVIGNADNATSMSTTFNRINTGSTAPVNCYQMTSSALNSSQYFEIVISGDGSFTYKGCFCILRRNSVTSYSFINTLFYYAGDEFPNNPPIVALSTVGNDVTLSVDISYRGPIQSFITTLIGYPSMSGSSIANSLLLDYSITAI